MGSARIRADGGALKFPGTEIWSERVVGWLPALGPSVAHLEERGRRDSSLWYLSASTCCRGLRRGGRVLHLRRGDK